jgi:hypothetical protein
MGLSIAVEDEFSLSTHAQPSRWFSYLLIGMTFFLVVALLVSPTWEIFFALILCGGFGVYGLWSDRELSCTMNKQTGLITYQKGGVLGTQYDTKAAQYRISEVIAVEMVRYAERGRDVFQIRLAMNTGKPMHISAANLSFSECQEAGKSLQQFLGPNKPLLAVD